MYTVYQHINKINRKMYVGITSRSLSDRWGTNGNKYRSSPHFYSSIQKYGWNNFEHNVLFEDLTREEAINKEIELIAKYDLCNPDKGYNETSGGDAPIMSEAARKKLSQSMMGNQNNKGHACSEEKKKKISDAQKGRQFTEEHKQKLSEAAKKRHVPCSEEKKKKLSQNYPNKKQVYCEETDIIYESVQECARQLGLFATNISKVCRGIHHTTGGYHFHYYNDIDNA